MAADAASAAARALDHLVSLQSPRGDWEGEMVWCPMITAQVVITRHVVGRPVDAATARGIVRYFERARVAAGAWGLHPDSPGYVFVTALVYVALRLLGRGPDEPLLAEARRWLHGQPGGVLAIPTWGKLWLALLGLYGWSGVTPVLPELYALPRRLPFHPARWYCHTRYIYLGVACLYGRRLTVDLGALTEALRHELYGAPWPTLHFEAHRHDVTPGDLHVRPGRGLRAAAAVLAELDHVMPWPVRRRALEACRQRILYEQRQTRWQALSPVNGVLDCLVLWAHDPDDPALAASVEGLEAWRWEDAGGVRYAGARSNAWDTAFSVRALFTPGDDRRAGAIRRGAAFLRQTQMATDLPRWFEQDREPIMGGWCFSDGTHRWPVSDCTAEAVSALLEIEPLLPQAERLAAARRRQAADFILARQNRDGGFGTYEPRRGRRWLERLNASEMFGRCMTERSYVECTASCVGALARLARRDPGLAERLARPVAAGVAFLRASQRADGGWGEHWRSCLDDRYVEAERSQPVQTAWALLALLDVLGAAHPAVILGAAWLSTEQGPDGGWRSGDLNGVFFGTAMLDYRLYAAYFPAWALARYAARVP